MQIKEQQMRAQFQENMDNIRQQFEEHLPQNGQSNETIKELHKKFIKIKNKMSKEAAEKARGELKKVKRSSGIDQSMSIKYIEILLSLPWGKYSKDNKDLNNAKEILDEDHAHLEGVKERILEHLAVHQNTKSILCFVGPPGVGKTSMGQSIARAMNRKFTRLSLSGTRDEATIKGHRRTYIESMPGEIINHIIQAGTINPVFMLDEMDKIGRDFRGDPSAALLEVLDPEQNSGFKDNYLNIQFDLSQVFFIGTANTINTIPSSLLDRMEIIRLSSYTPYEKLEIAVKYLVPKIEKEIIPPVQIKFSKPAILALVNRYTEEAGVRQLERSLRRIFQKITKMYGLGEIDKKKKIIQISKNSLPQYYGKPRISKQTAYKKMPIGCSPVVAISSETGSGSVFHITINVIEQGKRSLKFRGIRASGDSKEVKDNVLEKSGHNAFDALISKGSILEKIGKETQNSRFTINATNGMTPKDGPSAGIAFLFAFYSQLTGVPMKPDLLATGEITPVLGRIGAVGGIRDKAIAVHRAGIKKFIIPYENRADIESIPKQVIDEVKIITAKTHWDALLEAFSHDQKESERIKKFIQKKK